MSAQLPILHLPVDFKLLSYVSFSNSTKWSLGRFLSLHYNVAYARLCTICGNKESQNNYSSYSWIDSFSWVSEIAHRVTSKPKTTKHEKSRCLMVLAHLHISSYLLTIPLNHYLTKFWVPTLI